MQRDRLNLKVVGELDLAAMARTLITAWWAAEPLEEPGDDENSKNNGNSFSYRVAG